MMKMNRKALALLASAMLAVSAAGCGNPAEDSGPALEAMASLPEPGKETGTEPDAGERAATAGPTAATTTEPTAEPTVEPTAAPTVAPTAEPTTEPTVEPTTEPAATAEPTVEPTAEPTTAPAATTVPTATAEPVATSEPATATAEPVTTESNSAAPVLASNAPATSGVVTSTETVTTQVEHQRPEGMPAVCYSQDETLMAMLLYGQPGDGYTDNGDGTWSYCWCGPDGSTTDTVTETVTTTNWYSGTEADVLAKLEELRVAYPDGTYWNDETVYDNPGSTIDAYISNDNACAGFAKLVSDYCFGYDAPCRRVWKSIEELKVGDIVIGMNHGSVYTGGYEGWGIKVVDGNDNDAVRWDRDCLVNGEGRNIDVITRWPE